MNHDRRPIPSVGLIQFETRSAGFHFLSCQSIIHFNGSGELNAITVCLHSDRWLTEAEEKRKPYRSVFNSLTGLLLKVHDEPPLFMFPSHNRKLIVPSMEQ